MAGTTSKLFWVAVLGGLGLMVGTVLQAQTATARNLYDSLPLTFEENHGQTDGRARFLARGAGYGLFLTSGEAVLALRQGKAEPRVLRLRWAGANPSARVAGKERLPGRIHYLVGADPAGWRTGIPTYARIAYEEVYPGIDLVFYGKGRQLEYDLVVSPGANPAAVRFSIEGADRLAIDPAGDLVLALGDREVRLRKPFSYQEADGARSEVASAWRLLAGGAPAEPRVGFEIAGYDASKPLLIDPVLVYSTFLGGSDADEGLAVAADAVGNSYITGVTSSPDFPTTPGALQTDHRFDDAFVVKLDPQGALVYSTFLGGTGGEFPGGIDVDRRGHAFVTGGTSSDDFPLVHPLPLPPAGEESDAFIAKLSPDGSALVYSTRVGGSRAEGGAGIAVDPAGHAYVAGTTSSADFPVVGTTATFKGEADAFVLKLAPSGSALVYSTLVGGFRRDQGRDVAIDPRGYAYVAGDTSSPDFPTLQAVQATLRGHDDAFAFKLAPSGASLVYSTYLGGGNIEEGFSVAADAVGNAYVTGNTWSTDFPTFHALQPASPGVPDAFVTKLAPGGPLVYSTYLGGSASDGGTGIALGLAGAVWITGITSSADYPLIDPLQPACVPVSGLFCGLGSLVTQLDSAGERILFSTVLADSVGNGIALDRRGGVHVTGVAFPAFQTLRAVQPTHAGGDGDAFAVRILVRRSGAGGARFDSTQR